MYQNLGIGDQLRDWRQRRRLSQLDLALQADLSARHLSFLETGRSRPSREMLLRLAEALDLPLRSRNALLIAGGFAPIYPERPLEASPSVRDVVQRLLDCHMPFPALAIDRGWNLIAANVAIGPLIAGAAPELLQPPVNVLRLSLHPKGLASRIQNLGEWKRHILSRLGHQIAATGDPLLEALRDELSTYPAPASKMPVSHSAEAQIAIPLSLTSPVGQLDFLSTTTVFGTPVDVTLSELAIESFFPANAATGDRLRELQSSEEQLR